MGPVSVSILQICVRLSMPVIFSSFQPKTTNSAQQWVHPCLQYIPAACRNTRPSESHTHTETPESKTSRLSRQNKTQKKYSESEPARLYTNDAGCVDLEWIRTLLSWAQLKVHFRAWSLFWAIKLPGTKENHILPGCLTDNSPLNDLLLGVNYANDAQTNSSRGQLRQPLISGQFPSCFTDIQLKNCLRTSTLSGARRSWRGAVQRWAAAAQLFDEAEL